MVKSKETLLKVTTNYDKFNFIKFNRKLNEGLVKRLMSSIKEIGYVTGKPVIVDKDMNIIDGQHRFEACKRLKLPIYYTVEKADVQKAMMNLNAQQSNWQTKDYISSYAESGLKCYADLLNFDQLYGLGISNSLEIFFEHLDRGSIINALRKGKIFKVNTQASEIARFITDCNLVPYYKSAYFVRAVTRVYKKATKAQLEKLKAGIVSLPQQATAAAYIASFENIVNRGLMAKNRVSYK